MILLANSSFNNTIIDIDECAESTSGCAQICTNQDGSYSCSCGSGYRLGVDEHGCEGTNLFIIATRHHCRTMTMTITIIDVNECTDENLNSCEQLCNNTAATHTCLCFDGYELNSDRFSCSGLKLSACGMHLATGQF